MNDFEVQVSVHRLKFLRKCLKNDLIPDFLKFRVPENGFFFQTKLCICASRSYLEV